MEIYLRNPWNDCIASGKRVPLLIYLEYIRQKTGGAMQKAYNYINCLVTVVTKRRWSVL
jgi:hypothetical protein